MKLDSAEAWNLFRLAATGTPGQRLVVARQMWAQKCGRPCPRNDDELVLLATELGMGPEAIASMSHDRMFKWVEGKLSAKNGASPQVATIRKKSLAKALRIGDTELRTRIATQEIRLAAPQGKPTDKTVQIDLSQFNDGDREAIQRELKLPPAAK